MALDSKTKPFSLADLSNTLLDSMLHTNENLPGAVPKSESSKSTFSRLDDQTWPYNCENEDSVAYPYDLTMDTHGNPTTESECRVQASHVVVEESKQKDLTSSDGSDTRRGRIDMLRLLARRRQASESTIEKEVKSPDPVTAPPALPVPSAPGPVTAPAPPTGSHQYKLLSILQNNAPLSTSSKTESETSNPIETAVSTAALTNTSTLASQDTNKDHSKQYRKYIKSDVESVEVPKGHPLQYAWKFHFQVAPAENDLGNIARALPFSPLFSTTFNIPLDSRNKPRRKDYPARIQELGEASDVEGFCRYFNWVKKPSELEVGESIMVFKAHIPPLWEHEKNQGSGKWNLSIQDNQLLERSWSWLVMSVVGEELDPAGTSGATIAGVVLTSFPCPRPPRIQIWVEKSSGSSIQSRNELGVRLMRHLELSGESGVLLEWRDHITATSKPAAGLLTKNSGYIRIDTLKPLSASAHLQGYRTRESARRQIGINGGVLGAVLKSRSK